MSGWSLDPRRWHYPIDNIFNWIFNKSVLELKFSARVTPSTNRPYDQIMLRFKSPEEKTYITHFAKKMGDSKLVEMIKTGKVKTEQDAEYLSLFFWRMVDQSIEDDMHNIPRLLTQPNEFWNEKIMYSIAGHLQRAGYEHIWEHVSDAQ